MSRGSPDFRRVRGQPDPNLPFVNVNNQIFQQVVGPQLRHQVFPGNAHNAWRVEVEPTLEPGNFTTRIILNYPPNLLVPVDNRVLTGTQLRNLWGSANWRVITNFGATVRNTIQILERENDTRYINARVYLVHESNRLDLAGRLGDRRWNGVYFNLNVPVLAWRNEMQESVARALMAFIENYQDEFPQDFRNLSDIRIFVELQPQDLGAAGRNGFLPELLRAYKGLWGPSGNLCFLKCMKKVLGKSQEFIQSKLPGFRDNMETSTLFHLASKGFPTISFRLLSLTGDLVLRTDGAEFEDQIVFLISYQKHYYLITNIKDYQITASRHHYCTDCDRPYLEEPHRCSAFKYCECCDFKYSSDQQFQEHKNASPLGFRPQPCLFCSRTRFESEACCTFHSLTCNAKIEADKLNKIGEIEELKRKQSSIQCKGCNSIFTDSHVCYLEPFPVQDPKFHEWYAFDYESMLIDDGARQIHKVNFVCVSQLYADYKRSFKTLDQFFAWMNEYLVPKTQPDGTPSRIGMVAHNLKGYDGRLTLAKIFQSSDLCSDMIWVMAKINTFTWKNVVFRDSLLHIPMPLSKFPETFGLNPEGSVAIAKGHFPYLFNTPDHQEYIGKMPDIKYFQPNFMSPSARKQFIKWYNDHKDDDYNFQLEIEKYCMADVDILAKGLEVYSKAGMELNGTDPLEKLTIASYTTSTFLTQHLPENTIAWHNETTERNAREALRGGKTDVRVFYKKYDVKQAIEGGKCLAYVDVQSMYPFVMHKEKYPAGKVSIKYYDKLKPFTIQDICNSFGFAMVTVDPPLNYVHHPALVGNRNGRLCATLERWSDTVFTTVELEDAFNQGWRLVKCNWIQSYQVQTDELFKKYIELLISEKLHSSDIDLDDETKKKWLDEFNVLIDETKINYNAGKRQIAKLMLNSLWGKLSEKYKPSFTSNCDAAGFRHYENEEKAGNVEINIKYKLASGNWFLSGKKNIDRNAKFDKDLIKHSKKTCVAIGSFVTMYGRRVLWKELVKLGKRVVYHDTDSVIYEFDPEKYNVKEGGVLGEWASETKGWPIIEFVALAPKTYAYRYLNMKAKVKVEPEMDFAQFGRYELYFDSQGVEWLIPVIEVCKVKGFKLHYDAMTSINFDGLLALYSKEKNQLFANQVLFEYERSINQITTRIAQKALVFQYEKGVIGGFDQAFPFGVEKYWNPVTQNVEEGDPLRGSHSAE